MTEESPGPRGGNVSSLGNVNLPKIKDRVRELWPTETSVSEMARMLSAEFDLPISKNMISGYAGRMKLQGRVSPIKPKKEVTWTEKKVRKQRFNPTPVKKMFWTPDPKPVPPQPKKAEIIPAAFPVAGENLRMLSCRWPEWGNDERPKHLYCGQVVTKGQSYCPYHCTFAFQPRKGVTVNANPAGE